MEKDEKVVVKRNPTTIISGLFLIGCIVVLLIMLYTGKNASAAYKVNVSDLIESVVSSDTKAASELLRENKIKEAVSELLKKTLDTMVRDGNYTITGEQAQSIEESLSDMLTTMTQQGLIDFTDDGELTTFSKYYLADAVAYSITSSIGDSPIIINNSTVSDNFSLDSLSAEVVELRDKYNYLEEKYASVTGNKTDMSSIKDILEQYTILSKDQTNGNGANGSNGGNGSNGSNGGNGANGGNGSNGTNGANGINGTSADAETLLELMLQVKSLETMVKTLQNSEYTNTNNTFTSETINQINTITKEIERIKESMQNGDAADPNALYNINELTMQLAKLSEKVNGMDLSGIETNNNTILREIQERQTAITQLQEKLTEISNDSELKTLQEKLNTITKEFSSLQSEVRTQNSTNETTREVWKKETESKIESLLKEIQTINSSEKTTAETINNLKETVELLKTTINNMGTNTPGSNVDLSDLYGRINSVQMQIISGSNNQLETVFKGIQGDTVAAKVGCLSQTMETTTNELKKSQDDFKASVSSEVTTKLTELTNLKNEVNNNLTNINNYMEELQQLVNGSGSKEEIDAAKKELEEAIKALQNQLGDITNIGGNNNTLAEYITELNKTLTEVTNNINNINGDTQNLTNRIEEQKTLINTQYTEIKKELDEYIKKQLQENQTAIEELKKQINGDPDNPGGGTSILQQITNIQNNITNEDDPDSIISKITNIENTIHNGLGSEALDKETADRKDADEEIKKSLKDQLDGLCEYYNNEIKESAAKQSNNLDDLAGKLTETNTTLQTLTNNTTNNITALQDTNDWVTNIYLSNTTEPGRGFALVPSNNTELYSGWHMWTITDDCFPMDGQAQSDVTFRACNEAAGVPESDITIVYKGAPKIVLRYIVEDGKLNIYTPSVPAEPLIISSMHVQNMLISEDM